MTYRTEQNTTLRDMKDRGIKLKNILDVISEPAILVDSKLIILDFNERLLNLTKLTPADLLEKSLFKLINFPGTIQEESIIRKKVLVETVVLENYIGLKLGESVFDRVSFDKLDCNESEPIILIKFFKQKAIRRKGLTGKHKLFTNHYGLMDSIPFYAWSIDPSGRLIYANNYWTNAMGTCLEDIKGSGWVNIVHPEDIHKCFEALKKAVEHRTVIKVEIRLKRAQGDWGYFLVVASPILDNKGEIIEFIGWNYDITDKKLVERALVESEEKYRQLFNNAKDAIYLLGFSESGELSVLEANDTACQRTGYDSTQIVGLSVKEFTYSRMTLNYPTRLQEILTRGSSIFETEVLTKNGTVLPVEISAHLFELKGEKIVWCISRDITERKKGEAEIIKLNNRLKTIIYSSPVGQIFIDEKGIVNRWNYEVSRIFGLNKEEILGLSVEELITKLGDGCSEFSVHPMEGDNQPRDLWVFREDTGNRYLRIFSSPMDGSGEIASEKETSRCLLVTVQDTTLDKKREKELEESRRKASKFIRMASLGAMAAGIAHEIKQPLNALRITTEGLRYLYKQGSNLSLSKVMDTVTTITHDVDRINEITNRMRALINNSIDMEVFPCDINKCIEEALKIVKNDFKSESIEFDWVFDMELPKILGVKSALEGAFLNILMNSCEAFSSGNREAKKVIIKTWFGQGMANIQIIDNATGISSDQYDKLFEPFYTGKLGKGMGLGLFITHAIVTGLNGQISVRNNELGGATCSIELPIISA